MLVGRQLGTMASGVGGAGTLPIVGREHEIEAIRGAVDAASTGRFQLVVLEGEPGIGKSRLLRVAHDLALARGFVVVEGAGDELDPASPFGPLADALLTSPAAPEEQRRLVREDLLDERPPGEERAAVRSRLLERYAAIIDGVVAEQPLLLCLDDVQWADEDTFALLSRLPRRLAFSPLALVVARRRLPASPAIDRLLGRLGPTLAAHLPLEALSHREIAEVATAVLTAPPGPRLEAQLRSAGGTPLLLAEMLDGLLREDSVELRDGRAEVASTTAPLTLRAAVMRRMERLPPDTAEVVRVAAVLGPSFGAAELARTVSLEPRRLAAALAATYDEGLLAETAGVIGFRHHLVRDVVYRELADSVRAVLHLAVAETLAAAGAPAARVASHYEAAAVVAGSSAVEWLRRAARDALSPVVALEFLERAAQLDGARRPSCEALLAELAEARLWAGRPAHAEDLARSLLPGVRDPLVASRLLRVRFRALGMQGKADDLLAIDDAQLAQLEERDRALILAEAAYAAVESRHDPEAELAARAGEAAPDAWEDPVRARAQAMAHEALAAGERLGDPEVTCLSLCALSSSVDCDGYFADAIELSTRAAQVADSSPDNRAQRHAPHFHLALQLLLADRLAEAETAITAGLARAEAAGVTWVLPLHQYLLGRVHFMAGQWDEAVADWETALDLAEETGTRMIVGDAARTYLAQVALHRGDLRAAESLVTAAEQEAAAQNPGGGADPFPLWARALMSEARGDVAAAAATAALVNDVAKHRHWLALYRLIGPDIARIAAAGGRPDVAAEAAAGLRELARRGGSHVTAAAADLASGYASGDTELLLRAAEGYGGSGLTFEHALALEAAGSACARAGDTERAGPLLSEAAAVYEGLRAVRLSVRVEKLLQASGTRPRRRGRPRREAVGWDSLTPAERRVAALVAEGLSNARIAETLVISPRTVHAHVAHIFTKLGMNSRAQLAAETARRVVN